VFVGERKNIMTATVTDFSEAAFERSLMKRFREAEGVLKVVAAQYRAGRISNGDLMAAVVQSTKFEFVINLQTAKSLGIDVPATLLSRAVIGTKQTSRHAQSMSAFGGKADMGSKRVNVCF
jgi:hypothetical protein